MGTELKRKVPKKAVDSALPVEKTINAISEPPSKRPKLASNKEFIKSLQGPNALEALIKWLYLISNEKERAQLDKESHSFKPENSTENSSIEGTADQASNSVEERFKEDEDEPWSDAECSNDTEQVKCVEHIDSFLCSGGSPSILVQTLPPPEIASVPHVRYVFRALSKVLLRISADYPNYVSEAVDVCRELIGSYSNKINEMLRKKSTPERILTFELLTAMAALSPAFAKEILQTVSLEAAAVEKLISLGSSIRLRIAYLKFLITLLIDADTSLILTVVHKPWLLTSVMENLQYDPSDIVVLFLMTIKKTVLENRSVSKSSKMVIFSPDNIISLLHLYKWKGPANRPKLSSYYAAKKKDSEPKVLVEVDSAEAECVSSAIHELLLVLVTHHQYGITSVAHHSFKKNSMVSGVLQRIEHPWENSKVSDLVSKILAACPESLQPTLKKMEPFIKPRSSTKWFDCMSFLKQVLEDQRPEEILKNQLSRLSRADLSAAVIGMCIPTFIVCTLSADDAAALHASSAAVARCTADLFVTMLRKTNEFLKIVKQWTEEGVISHSALGALRRDLNESLLMHVPNLKSIQKAWQLWSDNYLQLESNDSKLPEIPTDKPLDILSLLMELLESYYQLCPAVLDPLRSAECDLKSSMMNTVRNTSDSEDVATLRNRLYKLLLDINDPSFNIENKEVQESMCLVFNDMLSTSLAVKSLAWSVLLLLIKKTGSLEGSPQEAIIWLSVFQNTFTGRRESLGEASIILVESMARVSSSGSKFLDILAHSEEEAASIVKEDSSASSFHFDWSAFQELLADNQNTLQASSFHSEFEVRSASPWMAAFLEVQSEFVCDKKLKKRHKKAIEEFCCKLILRLLYRLPHPLSFLLFLLNSHADVISSDLQMYLRAWLPNEEPIPVGSKLLGEDSIEVKLCSFLFCKTEDVILDQIQDLFSSFDLTTADAHLKDISEIEWFKAMILQVVHFLCFHLAQFVQLQKLNESNAQNFQDMFFKILGVATQFDKQTKMSSRETLLFHCHKIFFCNPNFLQHFNPLYKHGSDSSALLTKLSVVLVKEAPSHITNLIAPYKNKFLGALKIAVDKKSNLRGDSLSALQAFSLKFHEISDLLNLIANLPASSIAIQSDRKTKLSQWWYLAAHLFSQASALRKEGSPNAEDVMILPPSTISLVSKWVLELLPNETLDLSCLIQALFDYMNTCPQQMAHISDVLLPRLFGSKHVTLASSKLVEQLALCSDPKNLKLILESDLKNPSRISERLCLILPVLRVTLKKVGEIALKKYVLPSIYEHMSSTVESSIISLSNDAEWLPRNADVVVLLCKKFMASDQQERIRSALEKKAPVLTLEKLHYLELITEVLRRKPSQLLLLLLAWLGVSLKKYGNSADQGLLVQSVCKVIRQCMETEVQDEYGAVKGSKVWQDTLKQVLKFGLSSPVYVAIHDANEDLHRKSEELSSLLIQTLSIILRKLYNPDEEHEHITMILNMTVQHSEFVNVMMGSSLVKYELIELLFVLLNGRRQIMDSSYVPVLLAAYNASLSKIDRALLRLLMLFEKSGVDLSRFRPYFWGPNGADHYSIWTHGSSNNKPLWKQPRPEQVLAIFDDKYVRETAMKFPLQSSLNVEEDSSEFVDEVYDPAFCLPLFMYLLSPESPVITHTFVRSGALAITFSCLSSFDVAVRAAAYSCLSRFVSHLQMARGRNTGLLIQFMSAVQQGVSAFEGENPRIPSVATAFLARTTLEISNPLSPLYRPLMNYVLLRPAMDLKTVPEFFRLFQSDYVEHVVHRHWILEVLTAGLRSPVDIVLSMELVVFKLLPSFYSSCLSDLESKIRILRSLRSALGVQYGACRLVRDYSLISWLHGAISSMNQEDFSLISEMVNLVSTMWDSLSQPTSAQKDPETEISTPEVKYPQLKVLYLLNSLLRKLSAQTSLSTLNQYVSVLYKVMNALAPVEIVTFSKDNLQFLIEVSSSHFPNKREFYDILDLGWSFIDDEGLSSCSLISKENNLRYQLKTLIVCWMKSRKECSLSVLS